MIKTKTLLFLGIIAITSLGCGNSNAKNNTNTSKKQ